jgi:septum site-determining protein MinC
MVIETPTSARWSGIESSWKSTSLRNDRKGEGWRTKQGIGELDADQRKGGGFKTGRVTSIIRGIMGQASTLIQIKGIRDGLLVALGGGEWPDLVKALIENIDSRSAFFQGGRVALDVGSQDLRVTELSALRDKLSERGVKLWAVLSESPLTETTAQNLGLATRITKPRAMPAAETAFLPEDAAKWVKGPLRSGGHVAYGGNVVVMGDVNPGAEIIAGGSIIIWGRLRGVVHAGAHGDESAVVCALEMLPTQLRIAGEIAVSPKKQGKSQPEVARLKDGSITAEPWQTNTGR